MRFKLTTITHNPYAEEPLKVVFETDDGVARELLVTAAKLATFARFRAEVADVLGVWLEDDCPPIARLAKARWDEGVSLAFDAGSEAAVDEARQRMS